MIDSALLHALLYERGLGIMVLPSVVHEIGRSDEERDEFIEEVVAAHVREIAEMLDTEIVVDRRCGRAVYLRNKTLLDHRAANERM